MKNMATTQFAPGCQSGTNATASKSAWTISIAAVILALLLGLSAADIQRQSGAGTGIQPSVAPLDGRGKWGGYL